MKTDGPTRIVDISKSVTSKFWSIRYKYNVTYKFVHVDIYSFFKSFIYIPELQYFTLMYIDTKRFNEHYNYKKDFYLNGNFIPILIYYKNIFISVIL